MLVFTRATLCPHVRHTPVLYQNKNASVVISSLSGSPTILVFWSQISSGHSRVPPSGGLKQGWGGKIQPFSSFKDDRQRFLQQV